MGLKSYVYIKYVGFIILAAIVLISLIYLFKKKRNMRPWLKGGLIGAGISVILFLLSFLEDFLFFGFISFIIMYLNFWLPLLGFCVGDISCIFYVSSFLSLIEFFIIGALIGWIVGKRKSKEVVS